jgi:MFS family permease
MSTAVPSLRQDAKVIGLVGLAHGVSHFFHLILAALFPWLKVAFNLSYAELGLLVTMFFVISGVGQALAGFVVDRVGARAVLFFGIGMLGVAALLLSQAQSYSMLMAGSMLAGVGNSVFHPADLTLLNKRVSTPRLGHAFSVHGISGNIGWAAAPVFLTTLAALFDWRTALFSAAFVPFSVLLLLFVNRGLLGNEDLRSREVTMKKDGHAEGHILDFLRLPSVWLCFAFFLITALALGGIQNFSSPGLRDLYGMSLTSATVGYTVYMLASAAGMLWGGFLASKAARHDRTIALAFAASGFFALVIATGAVPALVAVALMGAVGFGAGIAAPSRDLMIRAAAPKNATGRVYGVVYSGLDTGLAIAPLMFGALMDANRPAWVFVGVGLFQCLAIVTAVSVGTNTARRATKAEAVA